MKTVLAFSLALFGYANAYAQSDKKDSVTQLLPIIDVPLQKDSNKTYPIVDGDGFTAPFNLVKYLTDNVAYPEDAKKKNIQGTVYVSFTIEKDGSVDNVKLLRGVKGGKSLDSEAVRIVSAMPKWTPGKQNGHPVRIQYRLPIHFVLSDSTSANQKKN